MVRERVRELKRNTWTLEEDAIVIREYKNNPGKYTRAAMNHLPDRSRHAISSRWNLYLRKHHSSDTTIPINAYKKWTPEEDAIIVREYKNNPGNYLGAAMNHLPGRSRGAISLRWYLHLKKHYPSATI